MATYPLNGGPCDGRRTRNFTSEPPDEYIYVCGGASYIYYRANPGIFNLLNVSPTTGGGGGVMAADNKQVGRAWHKLMHVFAVEAPQSIRRARAARSRLKRLSR